MFTFYPIILWVLFLFVEMKMEFNFRKYFGMILNFNILNSFLAVFNGSEAWQTFSHVNSTEEEEGPQQVHEGEDLSHDELHRGISENEDDHGLGDDATHIDVTRNNFEELLDTMGEHEDVDHIEDVVVEDNRET